MRGRRDLLLLASGLAVSVFGSAMTGIVLLLQAQPKGGLAVAAVLIAELVPVIVAAPVSGVLVDRLPNKRLLSSALVLQAGGVGLIILGLASLPVVLIGLVLVGFGASVANPTASALVPAVAGEEWSTRGYAWVATGRSFGTLVGVAVGGVLVGLLGAHGALLVDGLTYLVDAALVLTLRADRVPHQHKRRPRALDGWRFLRADPVLLTVVASLAVTIAGIVLINVADVFFVVDVLGGGAITIGLLQGCWMIGMLTGARVAARLRSVHALVTGLGVAGCTIGLASMIPAAVPFVLVNGACFLLGGISNAVQNVTQQGLVRLRTPEDQRGRVFAATGSLLNTANVSGTVAGGFVVGAIGPRWTFAVAGTAALLSGLAALVLRVRTRETAPVT
ncbi:MFS transporter [Labedaea rhizosphaerae]|uniref:Putative MFS family arabinose efflux permease n=1 Tax=Labedaea rhizosphaerae TaxID=598644 RepID=A0A4R6SEA2_LABRH|nr:MFS transporter [Labedaea rhizosphaerae]TDP97455.1 putative MFS family arabinose efflux permease [Labedaea rhizosphaerae]